MNKHKIISYVLIIIPLVFLIALNFKIFTVRRGEELFKNVDIVKERYLRTLKPGIPSALDGWEVRNVSVVSGSEGINPENVVRSTSLPGISGKSALIVDNKTGDTLLDVDAVEKRPIASLVKIMTAVVALEHGNLDSKIIISKRAAGIGENAMGISEGETYTLGELLYGMLLNSGNDAATAIAEGVAGNVEMFVEWMNIKAGELSLKNTYFADPCGLDNSSYSTAEDLAKLTHFALKFPEFRDAVKTVEKEIPQTDGHAYISLSNQTNLLTTYPGVLGVKTGYTEESGMCLVTYAVNDGRELIGVVLNSVNRKIDMINMLDYGFSTLGINIDHPLLIFAN